MKVINVLDMINTLIVVFWKWIETENKDTGKEEKRKQRFFLEWLFS